MAAVGIVVLLALASAIHALPYQSQRLHPDTHLNVLQLIEKYGYPLERHSIETEDGYILEMQRIPHGLSNAGEANKPAVLVMHGLSSSAADWVNFGKKSLGFILADLGYDVWLGNARGNRWSRKHKTFNPDVDLPEFWSFSWNEIGKYDLPAKIDYILEQTGTKKIHYVGHSQGTTSFFVMASTRPEYNNKIKLMSALAPVAFMDNMFNPFAQKLAEKEEDLEWISENLGLYEFLPANNLTENAGEKCDDVWQNFCTHLVFLICGYDSEQLDPHMLSVITTNIPAGTSTRQFLHFAQEINSGYFRKYDYHSEEDNIAVYGQPTPPEYNLSQITAPVALHYGQNDWLAAVVDVERLRAKLPNVVLDNKIAYKKFNHLDFLWANDIMELLYNDLIDNMAKY